MELERAHAIAENAVAELKPYCLDIRIAGSIRRKRPFVHDIDLVCIPANQGQFLVKLQELGKLNMGGAKVIRVSLKEGIELDVYVANENNWYTLFLIRTGSARHNIMLCSRAKSMGLKLHADGSGLFKLSDTSVRLAGDSEESIFETLNLPYKEPEERE